MQCTQTNAVLTVSVQCTSNDWQQMEHLMDTFVDDFNNIYEVLNAFSVDYKMALLMSITQ